MKWKLTQPLPWFRKACLWAWWEIVSNVAVATVLITMLIVANMVNGLALVLAIAIATGTVIWHFGWLNKRIRECLVIVLVCVLGSLAIGAGYGIGLHKAEEWSRHVTYDFSPRKEKKVEPEKKKSEQEKEPKPGSPEYFDAQFAELRKEMKEMRSEVKSVRGDMDGIKKRLKIDFKSEDEPLDFPKIFAKPEKKEVPPPPPENDGRSGLRLKVAPDGLPPIPDEEEPKPIELKKPAPKQAPGKFERQPKSPGNSVPKIPSITKVAKIVGSECSFGKKHPIEQFCEGSDGRLHFIDEARDRCKDKEGNLCVCKRWIHENESP